MSHNKQCTTITSYIKFTVSAQITTNGPHGPGKCSASIKNVRTKVLLCDEFCKKRQEPPISY